MATRLGGLWGLLLVGVCHMSAQGDVRLPALWSDHMVLQQRAQVTFRGWAFQGETVEVEASWGAKATTRADSQGTWQVTLATPAAEPLHNGLHPQQVTFRVPNENAVQIQDLLIGEVWLCSGQSNMTMMLGPDYPPGHNNWWGEADWAHEMAQTQRPALRVFNVEKSAALTPQSDCKGVLPDHITLPQDASGCTPPLYTGWQSCRLQTAPFISAVAYHFGATLQDKLDVPVGLIISAVGGSRIEAWLKPDPQHHPKLLRSGPCGFHNAMLAPLAPMTLRGMIWYQGESNCDQSTQEYQELLTTFISQIRSTFTTPESPLPVGLVQLANFGKVSETQPRAPRIRAAQDLVARSLPNVGLAVAIDLGEENIHPPRKKEVGQRLALWARDQVYHEPNLVAQGPHMELCRRVEGAIEVDFQTGSPLRAGLTGNPSLSGFELAGSDGLWHAAEAVVTGQCIRVSSPNLPQPQAIRYAWRNNPQGCNLYNEAGLPAVPFQVTLDENRELSK